MERIGDLIADVLAEPSSASVQKRWSGGPRAVRRLPSLTPRVSGRTRRGEPVARGGHGPVPTGTPTSWHGEARRQSIGRACGARVGAVIVKTVAFWRRGTTGFASGVTHCEVVDASAERLKVPSGERHELCRACTPEQNAIIQAAYHGVSIQGAHLYCTNLPCIICAKMLINAGVRRIVYLEGYSDHPDAERCLDEVGWSS